jgi:hypothetical protein
VGRPRPPQDRRCVMTEEAINPLRRRMIEDMTVRNLDASTQRGYLRAVRSCSRYCGRRPELLTLAAQRWLEAREAELLPLAGADVAVASNQRTACGQTGVAVSPRPPSDSLAWRVRRRTRSRRSGRRRTPQRGPATRSGWSGAEALRVGLSAPQGSTSRAPARIELREGRRRL